MEIDCSRRAGRLAVADFIGTFEWKSKGGEEESRQQRSFTDFLVESERFYRHVPEILGGNEMHTHARTLVRAARRATR